MTKTEKPTPKDELIRRVILRGTQVAVAKELNVSPSHINDILKGKRNISPAILAKLGYVRIVLDVKADRAAKVWAAISKAEMAS